MIKLCKPEPAPCDTCPPLCQRKENYPRVCCQSCGLLLFSSMSDIFVPLKSNGERAQCNSMLHDSGPTDSVQQYNARVHVCYHSPQPPGWQGLPKGAELSDSLGALRKLSAGQCQQPHHGLGGLCNICNTSQHPPCVRFLILTCSCTALCCKCRCRTIMHVWTVAPRREWSTEYALQDTQEGVTLGMPSRLSVWRAVEEPNLAAGKWCGSAAAVHPLGYNLTIPLIKGIAAGHFNTSISHIPGNSQSFKGPWRFWLLRILSAWTSCRACNRVVPSCPERAKPHRCNWRNEGCGDHLHVRTTGRSR